MFIRILNTIPSISSNKESLLNRWKNVEVSIADEIIEQHFVQYGDEEVEGEQNRTDVIVETDQANNRFKISMTESYFESDKLLYDLGESLCRVFGIENDFSTRGKLQYVLALEDHTVIGERLDRDGIPRHAGEDDAEDYGWMKQSTRWGGGYGGGSGGGVATPGMLFRVISSANFHQFAHLFNMTSRKGVYLLTADEGFEGSDFSKQLAELGVRVILPAAGTGGGGGMWGDYEEDEEDERLQYLGELEVSVQTFLLTVREK